MRLVPLALACFVFSASAAALVSAVANAKIYEDPHKSLAQLSDEFKAVAAAPAARFKAGLNRGGRRAASRDAVRSVCLTPPCETEDIMGEPLVPFPHDSYHLDRIDRINSDTVHAVLHKRPRAAPAPAPAAAIGTSDGDHDENEATRTFIRDVKDVLATEGGLARDKRHDLERRIAVIEKTVGVGGGGGGGRSARMQIALLQRQLSAARAAIKAIIASQQDENARRLSQDLKKRLSNHIASMRRRLGKYVSSLRRQLKADFATIVKSAISSAPSPSPLLHDFQGSLLLHSARRGWIAIKHTLRLLRNARQNLRRSPPPPAPRRSRQMSPAEQARVAGMVEEGMHVQDAIAFVRKYPDKHDVATSSSSSRRGGSSSSSSSSSSGGSSAIESRLVQRLASQEMNEARRVRRLIRYVVGQRTVSRLHPRLPPSASSSPSSAISSGATNLVNAAAAEVAKEGKAAGNEAREEGATMAAAVAAARSSVATYLAHLEGLSSPAASSFNFESDEDDAMPSAPSAASRAPPLPSPVAITSKILGPAWTRGRIEHPAGSKRMAGWNAAVYTPEQQKRLNVDERGGTKKMSFAPDANDATNVLRHSASSTPVGKAAAEGIASESGAASSDKAARGQALGHVGIGAKRREAEAMDESAKTPSISHNAPLAPPRASLSSAKASSSSAKSSSATAKSSARSSSSSLAKLSSSSAKSSSSSAKSSSSSVLSASDVFDAAQRSIATYQVAKSAAMSAAAAALAAARQTTATSQNAVDLAHVAEAEAVKAALAAGTSIYSTQKQVAVHAAKAASAAKKRARTAQSRQWELETEAAVARHRAVMAQADAVRTVASAAALMRPAADKEQAEEAAAAASAAAAAARRAARPKSAAHSAAYWRVLKTAEHRQQAAAAMAAQQAAAAQQASPADAAAAGASAALSHRDAAQLSEFAKREALAKAAAVASAVAAAVAESAAGSAAEAHSGASKVVASDNYVRYVAQDAARERDAIAAEKAAKAAAEKAGVESRVAGENLAAAKAMKLKHLKESLQTMKNVLGGDLDFVDRLHSSRARDAAVATASSSGPNHSSFDATRALSLARLKAALRELKGKLGVDMRFVGRLDDAIVADERRTKSMK